MSTEPTPMNEPTAEQTDRARVLVLGTIGAMPDTPATCAAMVYEVARLLSRAERAEREAREAKADATVLADEVRKWRAAFSTWNANPKPNALFHDPHRAIDATDASGALTRNSAGGGE